MTHHRRATNKGGLTQHKHTNTYTRIHTHTHTHTHTHKHTHTHTQTHTQTNKHTHKHPIFTQPQAGYITGGSAGNLEERAKRWDEKVVDDLKAQRENLAGRLRVSGVLRVWRS